MNKVTVLILLAVALSSLSVKAQETREDDDSQERTLGLFRHRNRYPGYPPGGGSGGLFGGLLGSLFGGQSYNPYFGPGLGYPGSYSPYFGGPIGPGGGGFFGPGLNSGYAPGFGGYRQFPGGYSGGSYRHRRSSKDIGADD